METWIDALYVTTGDASRLTGYSVQGIVNLTKAGTLLCDMSPWGRLIRRDSLEAFIARKGVKPKNKRVRCEHCGSRYTAWDKSAAREWLGVGAVVRPAQGITRGSRLPAKTNGSLNH